MDLSLLLLNLGSFLLGMTAAAALLFRLASRNGADGAENCLGVVICVSGVGLATVCFVVATRLFI